MSLANEMVLLGIIGLLFGGFVGYFGLYASYIFITNGEYAPLAISAMALVFGLDMGIQTTKTYLDIYWQAGDPE